MSFLTNVVKVLEALGIKNKVFNDKRYVNTTGDLMTGGLQLDRSLNFSLVVKSANPTVALVAEAGNVNAGTHYYYCTYVTANGETELSGIVGALVTTDAGNGKVDVGVTASTDYRVTGIRIYRTGAGIIYYNGVKIVATISNVTQTYRDNIADASLTGAANSYTRDNTTNGFITINETKGLFLGNSTFLGVGALNSQTTGKNTAIGVNAGRVTSTGSSNVFVGEGACVSGNPNNAVIIGSNAGAANTGTGGVAVGLNALYRATTGAENTALGYSAGGSISTGGANTFLGSRTGFGGTLRELTNSVFVGYYAGSYETASNKIIIDNLNRTDEATSRSSALIYGVTNATPASQTLSLGGGGNVGIGTTSPTQKLDVNGKIAINGVQTIYNAQAFGGFTGSLIIGDGGTHLSHTTGSEGYYNTGVGIEALSGNTTGSYNIALGYRSLLSNTTGNSNFALGDNSINSNTTGEKNIAIGGSSLRSSKTGSNGVAIGLESQRYVNDTVTPWTNSNTSIGYQALMGSTTAANNTGNNNTAIGYQSLLNNTTGSYNSAQGYSALRYNTTGAANSAQGYAALQNNTTGSNNSAQGSSALYTNSTGSYNSAQGQSALRSNTSGYLNSAQGANALYWNTTGFDNSAQGGQSLYSNTTGYNNSAQGMNALYYNTTGNYNTAQGVNALMNLTGNYDNNTAVGYNAGRYYNGTTGNLTAIDNSILLGTSASALNGTGDTNEIVIGYNAIGLGSNTIKLGNTSITNVASNGDFEALDIGDGFILKSPDGTRYRITVANGGALSAVAV